MGSGPDDRGLNLAALEAAALEAVAPAGEVAATSSATMGIAELIADTWPRLEARDRGEDRPIPVPWPGLAERIGGGLWPGLWMLVGGTGTGKTQLALQLALEAARSGVPVAYVGLELDAAGIVARLAGLLSRARWSDLYLGHGGIDLPEVVAARDELARLPIRLAFGSPMGWGYDELERIGLELREAHPAPAAGAPMLIVLDFLQLVGSPATSEGEPLRERIRAAAYHGRDLARRFNAAVLCVSATARDSYGRLRIEAGGALPWVEELVGTGKESGEIEYAADGVLVMVRENAPDDGETPIHLGIAKLRAGRTGWFHLRFNGHRLREATAGEIAEVGASTAATAAAMNSQPLIAEVKAGRYDADTLREIKRLEKQRAPMPRRGVLAAIAEALAGEGDDTPARQGAW